MNTTYTIKTQDRKQIKNVTFKFPELMNKSALSMIKAEYQALIDAQEELYATREKVRVLEKKVAKFEEEWKAKSNLFEIEFETIEKEVTVTKSNMVINGATVYDCNSRR